jgi:glycosyltransferase involved in cell wall biosynthesis
MVDKILVINRPTSIAEMLVLRRDWHVQKGNALHRKSNLLLTQVDSKTFTLDIRMWEIIRPLVMKRHWTPYAFGHPKVVKAVNLALNQLNIDTSPFAMFLSAPLFVPLLRALSPSVLVFDAQDNLLKHEFYRDVPHLETYYQYCIQHSDILMANSLETTEWIAKRRPEAIHIPNGVDANVFNTERSYQVPDDIKTIRSPIIGYAGKMQEMFDVQQMTRAIAELPYVNFVFIGQELNPAWTKHLWKYPNAYYLKDKPYWHLPEYLSAFDICIIPYNVDRQHGGDPIKFYEYLAMGKPIVTTRIGNVGAFADHPLVWIAETSDDFVRGLRRFLELREKNDLPILDSPLPVECTWHFKADKIIRDINQMLENVESNVSPS